MVKCSKQTDPDAVTRSDPIPGRCNAENRAGLPCRKYPVGGKGSGRCRLHGGASTGSTDPSVHEGNDHAAGNPGGAPPELNMNASTHGADCDWRKLDARLEGAAREKVDNIYEDTLKRARVTASDVPGNAVEN